MTERELLERALPMLIKLGDFIGNGELDLWRKDSLGSRCDLILDIQRALGGHAGGCNCFPHGPADPCTCEGCWACDGHVLGCTCDIDWDCEHQP